MANPEVGIRPYIASDAVAFQAAACESVNEVFPWMPWCHAGYSIEEASDWVTSRMRLFDEGMEYEFAIVDRSDRLLGGCGLNSINRGNHMANLGYWIRSATAGRGAATLAVRHLAEFAFSKTDLLRLEIVVAVGNLASQRVAEKSGAIREAVLRDRLYIHDRPHDAVMFAILRSEWRSA